MGIFCSDKPAPGFEPGSPVRSMSLQQFSGPTRRWLTFGVATLLLPLIVLGQSTAHPTAPPADYGKLPISFEANQGQSDPQVRFLSHGKGYSLYLTDRAAVLALTKAAKADRTHGHLSAEPHKGDLLRMELVQPLNTAQPTGAEQLPGRANYFIGNDPAQWHTDIPTYARVKYAGVYPGVDLVYYGNQRQLEYDFVFAAGADPKPVRLHFAGARKIKLNADGDLEVIAKNGEIAFHKPEIYQLRGGKRQPVDGGFRIMSGNAIGFTLGKYDRNRALVIDPTLVYSTYLGGSGPFPPSDDGDLANGIAVDAAGNAYVTGQAYSWNFPVSAEAFQQMNSGKKYGSDVAFVSKINPAGSALIYSTYLGGAGVSCARLQGPGNKAYPAGDYASGIAIDGAGNAYVTGQAYSTNFPVTGGALQTVNNAMGACASNAFISKLNATGSALLYSTYFGGSGRTPPFQSGDGPGGESGMAIAIDAAGNAYVTGVAFSGDLPVSDNAYQMQNHAWLNYSSNAFVAKINATGSALLYSTYLGGSGYTTTMQIFSYGDQANGIAIDESGDAYVVGRSSSGDFPTTSGAFQTANNSSDASTLGTFASAFVSKLNPDGSSLAYSTYLGGTAYANASGVAVDTLGSAYVTGTTASAANFPVTPGAFQASSNNSAPGLAFVTKFNPEGTALVYSTYLAGATLAESWPGTKGAAIAVDPSGNAYVTGFTFATDFPVTSDAYQSVDHGAPGFGSSTLSQNAFVTKLNADASALLYSTYIGGSTASDYGDEGNAIALDSVGNVYIAGGTGSIDFPYTSGAFQQVNNGAAVFSSNAFIARFAITTPIISTETALTSSLNPAKTTKTVTFKANVTPGSGSGIPTGTVGFAIDGGAPVYVTLNATSEASYSTSSLTAGQHTIVATYSGDVHYAASTSSLTEIVTRPPVKITVLSGSGQVATYGSWFADPLFLLVTDADGMPVFDTQVTFSGSGLLFLHQLAATDSEGIVEMTVKATAANTTLTASATVSGLPPATFSEYATDALLKVTPKNVTVPYGEAIPALTYTITGFVNGDVASVVTGAPTEYTEAVKGSPVGTYPILLNQGSLAAPNYGFDLLQGTLTITSDGAAAKPSFSPGGNSYAPGQMITITDSTPNAVIYYTTDGSTPTTSSPIYIGPITLNTSETIKALAVAVGYTNSPIQSEFYGVK